MSRLTTCARRTAPLTVAMLALLALSACSLWRGRGTADDQPTLKSLAGRSVAVAPDQHIASDEDRAIAAYRQFLDAAPAARQRTDAMRRLGDLEMGSADNRIAAGQGGLQADGNPDYRAAVARYRDYLAAYPKAADTDQVLYQLARAQEQGGQPEAALATLNRLVADFPDTATLGEAQFRRGELLFNTRDYVRAEQAYSAVLAVAGPATQQRFRERALYMQGWSRYKQGRLEDGLQSFFGVLDSLLAGLGPDDGRDGDGSDGDGSDGDGDGSDGDGDAGLAQLGRADRELVEDSFRVVSISLANLRGAESIAPFIDGDARRRYESRVYAQLAALYLKQDRVKDAADTLGLFARLRPLDAQAPVLQARVIGIYEGAGFATLALDAKKDYVSRYGEDGLFRQANPAGWERARPLVKTHLAALARHYHAAAQSGHAPADVQEAVRWYRASLLAFPNDADAPHTRFLLAELLFENGRHADAATEYEATAYLAPPHPQAADAGYGALLAHAALVKAAAPAERQRAQAAGVDSALQFAAAFPADPRRPAVLADAAETLHALGEADRATAVARQMLALQPQAPAAQRRVAWTVLAHTAFGQGRFDAAEPAYAEVLALTPAQDPARAELTERLAASVYKQGEQAQQAGRTRDAVQALQRVAEVAPQSAVRATAQYDSAAALIALKDWDGAARTLEDFRQRYPAHPLQAQVGGKLAAVYLEQGQWSRAAGEFERIAAAPGDRAVARSALWQAAELHEKAAGAARDAATAGSARGAATKAYARYLTLYPEPLEAAVETRWRLAALAKADGAPARELALMKDIVQADQRGGAARTDRTRYLGASASLALAQPAFDAYSQVALVEPLAKQLKLKKARMEEVLKAYAAAADYGAADIATAATHQSAVLYQDFGKALLASQRPKQLSKAEREQYDVLLEEQAFPFEEKAVALHEANARRAAQSADDPWVQRSQAALALLRPLRWGKRERAEGGLDAIR